MAKKHRKKYGKFYSQSFDNSMKTLLANIRFAGLDKPIKTIVVTSSVTAEGKSTASSNLACAMASSGKRTLIVDADLRRRSLGSMLGMHNNNGLYGVLSGKASLRQAVAPTKYPNLFFMDCESNIANPADVFATRRFAVLMEKLKQAFDYVVFDMPPIGLFVDAAVASNLADGTILCIRRGFTKRDMVQNALSQLESAEANVLGLVLTFDEETRNDYYYYYYNEDGTNTKKRHHNPSSTDEPLALDSPEAALEVMPDDSIEEWMDQTGTRPDSALTDKGKPTGARARSARTRASEANLADGGAQKGADSGIDTDYDPFAPGAYRSRNQAGKTGRSRHAK